MRSTITQRGRTTIPAECRRQLDWRTGSRVAWSVENGRLVGRADDREPPRSSLEKLQSQLKHPKWKGDTDAWLKLVRGS